MPRYFFHCLGDVIDHDEEGVELPDIEAARKEAMISMGETLRDEPRQIWDAKDFRIEVADASGILLFTLVMLAIDAPAIVDTDAT